MDTSKLLEQLLLWLSAVAVIAIGRARRNEQGVGLVLAYLVNLWLIHWLAVSLYLLPDFHNSDPLIVALGFEQSLYAVLAFAFGSVVLAPFFSNMGMLSTNTATHILDRRLPKAYILFGMCAFLALSAGLGHLPSATAILSTGQELVVAGLGLCCWQAWKERDYKLLQFWIGTTLLLPLVTVVTQGFIGYGAVAAFTVMLFTSTFIRSRVLILAGGIVMIYLALSVFVTYMRDRGEIRETVWGGQSFENRFDRIATSIADFEWFDPTNQAHLERVDGRLNQSFLVGLGVARLSDIGGYAHGATFWEAFMALIPRALWPDKPIQAGSGNLVSEYTGVQYAAGTSVGIGTVMEFYVNFGTPGVVIGFVVMGFLVTTLDRMAFSSLARNDLHSFVLWYLPGLSLLQVGGSLVEITTSAVASWIVAYLANRYLSRLQRKLIATEAPQFPFGRLAK